MSGRRAGLGQRSRGQGIAEFALVVPFALMLIFGIISIGLWVFYQQQLTNVAREAARYAAIHSSTAICPTTSWRDPQAPPASYPLAPYHCDGADQGWPKMVAYARRSVWGTDPTGVHINACWSGYVKADVIIPADHNYSQAAGFPLADYPPVQPPVPPAVTGVANQFVQCRIGGHDPTSDQGGLGCADGLTTPADDPSSDLAGNQVTAYACMQWSPPLAGFLLIPPSITMKAVVTEVIHSQQ